MVKYVLVWCCNSPLNPRMLTGPRGPCLHQAPWSTWALPKPKSRRPWTTSVQEVGMASTEWLVGGLEHDFYFYIIYIYIYIYWDNPSQLTFIFFKMVKTTNQSFFWHPPHRCRTTRSLGAWAFKRRTSIVETAVLFVSWLLDRWLRALNRDLTNEQRKLMRYTLR